MLCVVGCTSCGKLMASWWYIGKTLGLHGPSWGPSWAMLGPSWCHFGVSGGALGPFFGFRV